MRANASPLAHLSHLRLLRLLNQLERLVADERPLPELTAHFAADLVDFLELRHCRVLVPLEAGWRVAADIGWNRADAPAGAWLDAREAATLDGLRELAGPRLRHHLQRVADPGALHPGALQRLEVVTRIALPVRVDGALVALVELGDFADYAGLDACTVGFLEALATLFAQAVHRQLGHRAA